MNPAKDPEPDGVVTETLPLAPPVPTTAVICVALFTVKEAAAVPPKETAVAPVKLVPVITIVDPLYAEDTSIEVTVGAAGRKARSLPIAKYWVPVVRLAAVKLKLLLLATVNGLLPERVAACCVHEVPL